jgi:homoserine O-acetyltransferase/O-succinyltransferase
VRWLAPRAGGTPKTGLGGQAQIEQRQFIPIPSIWGHFAGGPGTNPEDVKTIDLHLKELLAS